MDIKICESCKHHKYIRRQYFCSKYFDESTDRMALCDRIHNCGRFAPIYEYNVILGDKMKNDRFKTILRSDDKKESKYLSIVDISCENYETFKKIVEAVMPILKEEDVKKECE